MAWSRSQLYPQMKMDSRSFGKFRNEEIGRFASYIPIERMWAFSSPRHHLRNVHLLPYQRISTLNSRPSTSKRRFISVGRRAHEMDGGRKDHDRSPQLSSNPKVSKLQQTLESSYDTDGWEKSWEQGLTPWDLGGPTPVILDLLKTGALPKGRALVPGCGSGHDVVALAGPERYVVGMDISDNAIQKAIEIPFLLIRSVDVMVSTTNVDRVRQKNLSDRKMLTPLQEQDD
ncbi:hypothetical protein ACLOJK_008866 [Asimina triloba]